MTDDQERRVLEDALDHAYRVASHYDGSRPITAEQKHFHLAFSKLRERGRRPIRSGDLLRLLEWPR
jgi:hypothetical protein